MVKLKYLSARVRLFAMAVIGSRHRVTSLSGALVTNNLVDGAQWILIVGAMKIELLCTFNTPMHVSLTLGNFWFCRNSSRYNDCIFYNYAMLEV
jgi:hypothetical protein